MPIHEALAGHRRLDAEMYLSEGFLTWREIENSELDTCPLGDIADVWQPGRLSGIEVAEEHGTPYLAATQVFDIWPRPRRWLALRKIKNPTELFVDPGVILITRSGTVGNSILSYEVHKGILISDDLLRVQVKEKGKLGYIYAFLQSRFGRAMMRSTHYGNVIKHLEAHHVTGLPLPILDPLVEPVGSEITAAYQARTNALTLEARAREILSQQVNYEVPGTYEECFSTSAAGLFEGRRRRLDAQAFNPVAEAAYQAVVKSGHPSESLGSLVETVFGVPRFKHVYSEAGIPYLDSEPLFKTRPEITKFIPPAKKTNAKEYFVQAGWLLMACSGQIYGLNGTVVLATKRHEGKIISNHVLRIVPREGGVRSGYLQAVLSHPVLGQPLVLRYAFGTEVPEISAEDIEQIPIVRLGSVETEIADLVEEASGLRVEADAREFEAIAGLEKALEKELGRADGAKKGTAITYSPGYVTRDKEAFGSD